jgi:acyl-CoA thioester hydrolase
MNSDNKKSQHCNITTGTIPIRVRYCEVDRMNAVHHSQYAAYFEMGRTELLRDNGYDYRDLEDQGILLVIAKLEIRYKAPAQYDDELELATTVTKIDRVRIEHEYELTRPKDNRLIAQAKTTLVHVDPSGKIQPVPPFLCPEET